MLHGCVRLSVVYSSVTYYMLQTLVVSLVLTRLDYGNSVLGGLPVPSSGDFSQC